MAIQNFISGGFYGKLGAMVGQRWRNKRTLRRYVIPNNPQTPLQQANRSVFSQGVKLAQEAMNLNKGLGLWYIEAIPEFSARVGQASRELTSGKSPADSLPIFPLGTVLSSLHTSATASAATGYPISDITVEGATSGDIGEFLTAVRVLNTMTNKWETFYQYSECYDGEPLEVSVDLELWHFAAEGSYISGVRTYEPENPTFLEEIKQVPIQESGSAYRSINLANKSWSAVGDTIVYILKSQIEPWFTPTPVKKAVTYKLDGQYTTDWYGALIEWVSGRDWKCTMPGGSHVTWDENTGISQGVRTHTINGLKVRVNSPFMNPWP